MIKVSVVICTRDRPAELERCLAAVAQLREPADEILVVDNSLGSPVVRDLCVQWGARYVTEPTPGLSRARNAGARTARGEVIAYIDDDTEPEPGWLAALRREFDNPAVGVVTGSVIAWPVSDGITPEFTSESRRVITNRTASWFELTAFGGAGLGSNMAFRLTDVADWPGFHEKLGRGTPLHGGEEHHAFFVAVSRGSILVYTPAARVRHMNLNRGPVDKGTEQRRQLRAGAAYFALLFAEEPRYRTTLLRYAWQAGVRRELRSWRDVSGGPALRAHSLRLTLWALMLGAADYVRSRFTDDPHVAS